jgi:hypothetical protein
MVLNQKNSRAQAASVQEAGASASIVVEGNMLCGRKLEVAFASRQL